MIKFDELLSNMKNAYFAECGENPSENAEALARIKAVCSELYNMACYGDFAFAQSFYQSATGEYLDLHANICGLSRKTPSKAKGALKFTISQPLDEDVVIPAGTICSLKDNPYIQFATLSNAIIPSGNLYVNADVEALGYGDEYNVTKTLDFVMVNPPAQVEGVEISKAIVGGNNAETDEMLRRRISASYDFIHNGIGKSYFVDRITNIDEVLDCNLISSGSSLTVICRTKNSTISSTLKAEIEDALGAVMFFGGRLSVRAASETPVDLKVIVRGGHEGDVEGVLQRYFNAIRIGEGVNEHACERLVKDECLATSCEVIASSLGVDADEHIYLNSVRVYYYD